MGVIVQARMGSTRLPGKVLKQAAGKPMLGYLLESLLHAPLGRIVVVTSDSGADNGIAALAATMGLACVRGSESDVASRFEAALTCFGFEAFVRLCGDSPLMDAELIRRGLAEFASGKYDLVTNTNPRSFPKGQSVEILSASAFRTALRFFTDSEDREHVTRWFYRNPARCRIGNFSSGGDWGQVQHSVDTPEDFRRFEALVRAAERPHWEYRWNDWVAMDRACDSRQGDGA